MGQERAADWLLAEGGLPVGTLPGSDFGSLFRRYRSAAGMTQAELAKRARIGEDTIGALERGINRAPHQETLDRLVKVMKLSREERALLFAAAQLPTRAARAKAWPGGFLQQRPSAWP